MGAAFFLLTIIFANMALDNNKMAREITMRQFDLVPVNGGGNSNIVVPHENNDSNQTQKLEGVTTQKEDKWKKFDDDFENKWKKF